MKFRPWALGLFILGGLILVTVFIFLIGNRHSSFTRHIEYKTLFSNLNGLAPGAKVRVSGIDAGKIKNIELPRSPSQKFGLELEIEEKTQPLIRKDSLVTIETEGVVGDKFISVKRGADNTEPAPPGYTLPSKEPLDLSAMMDRASGLLNQLNSTVGDVHGKVNTALDTINQTVDHADNLITSVRPNVQKIARDGGRITGNVDLLVSDLNAGKGPAGLLLRDEDTRLQLQTTMTNVANVSRNADEAVKNTDKMIKDFESRNLPEKTQVTLENAQSISQQLDSTLRDALAKDNIGVDGATNLRQTLSNLNQTTSNLAEDTEALKHNFLFRGFFKKRGFFQLDQITPDDYLKAVAKKKPSNRLWINPSAFTQNSDGQEELTDLGRSAIDAAVAPVVGGLGTDMVIVEGYATGVRPDQQFSLARERADLVRRYLEARYYLRHSDVGIVPLGTSPPPNAGQTVWYGACIVLWGREH